MKAIQQKIITYLENLGFSDVKFYTDKYGYYKYDVTFKKKQTYFSIECDTFQNCIKVLKGENVPHKGTYQMQGWKRGAVLDIVNYLQNSDKLAREFEVKYS